MKSILIIVISLLLIFTFWKSSENQSLKKEVKAQRDSIDNYHFNKFTNNGKNYNSKFIDDINDRAKEPTRLKRNDSILETHRITLYEGNLCRLARVDLKKDSSLDLTYWNGYSDCWGFSLGWEATIGYKTYSFGTSCTQAHEFTEACEIILRTIKDPEVVKYFKRRDE